jgi:glutaredoxin
MDFSVQLLGHPDNHLHPVPDGLPRKILKIRCRTAALKYRMKIFIRYFFRTLRIVLGPFMLLKEALTQPKGMVRTAAAQANVDAQCQAMSLYQFKTCPFCIKTRQEIARLSLNIQRVDAQHESADRQALLAGSGKTAVPCLRIVDAAGQSQWMTDSVKIIAYLRGRFTQA